MGAGWQRWWLEDRRLVPVGVDGRDLDLSKLRGWMTIRDVTLYADGRIEWGEPRDVYLDPRAEATT